MLLTTRRSYVPSHRFFKLNGFDQLFHDVGSALGVPATSGTIVTSWLPTADVREDKDSIRIALDLPGVNPNDVKIALEDRTLTIHGEKKQAAEAEERVHHFERVFGPFTRKFLLPNSVNTDRIEAKIEHGVLTLTAPKAEQTRPREIAVKVA